MRTPIFTLSFMLPAALGSASGFQSPSGNIQCYIDADYGPYARCDILQVDTPLRQPAYCDLDYGQAFGVDHVSRGAALCVGDTVMDPRNPVLNYGSSITHSSITCTSEETGMSCVNERGHGFTLSRKTQRLY